jgi:hypothetical protein
MKQIACLFLGGSLAIACGTDTAPGSGIETLPELTVPPLPANGMQIITPIFEGIQPATDYEVCTWTDKIFDKQTDVRSTLGYQNEPPGHHVILFYTLDKQPAGTQRVCTDNDMASFRFLAGAGTNGETNLAPGNLVYRIPAGAQIVVNHHYLNTSDNVMKGQSAINVNFAEPGNYIPSGNIAMVDTSLEVAQGMATHDIHCVLSSQMKLWYLIPHMHQWGKEITIDITKGGTKTRQFDTIWDPSFAFHPPEKRLDPATPMVLDPGDTIDVHCQWNNDSGRTLGFGFEMCVAFGETVDDTNQGNMACDAGHWGPF